MQPARDIQPQQQLDRDAASFVRRRAAPNQNFGNDIDGRDAWHNAQELADITKRFVANCQDGARIGAREIDHLPVVADIRL